MTIDWLKITRAHIQQACEQYDNGSATPSRPAKSTFLVLNGKSYPAKFIRGLAYKIATGIELDPNKDYSGGEETIRFFKKLGLETSRSKNSIAPKQSTATAPPTPKSQTHSEEPTPKRIRGIEPQKQALLGLLKKLFGTVECEAKFPWLKVPEVHELKEPLASIYMMLQNRRGFNRFITPGHSLRCDFYIPGKRIIIEYDEEQHFTLQRGHSLQFYRNICVSFVRNAWVSLSYGLRATDNNPPYRDEQRAFYDSMRDILAAQNGYRLIRITQMQQDWTAADAEKKLKSLLSPYMEYPGYSDAIKKIALVSHDYNVPNGSGPNDYSEDLTRINHYCDEQGCDTILYALYTWSHSARFNKTHDHIFGRLKTVRRVILEVFSQPKNYEQVELWTPHFYYPALAYQRFAKSDDSQEQKKRFVDELPLRQFGNMLLMICGETNIVSLVRSSKTYADPFGFIERLNDLNPRIILNPIHDYMRRPEMKKKRQYYSKNGRVVLSVWNKGKGREAELPWTAFYNGEDIIGKVQQKTPFYDRPDIQIGLLDMSGF